MNNLGNGNGFSVKEVVDAFKTVVARDHRILTVKESERRKGDPAILVADASKTTKDPNWQPAYNNLEVIIEHAWEWEINQKTC